MNEHALTHNAPTRKTRLLWLAVGVIAFGLIMGARGELPLTWQRSLAAGAAAVVLVGCVFQARKARG